METKVYSKNGGLKVNSCRTESFISVRRWNKSAFVHTVKMAVPPMDRLGTEQEKHDKTYPFIPQHGIKNSLFIEQITELIEANLDDEEYGITQLCRDFGISRAQLHRNLVAQTGLSASKYIRSIRIQKAIDLLLYSDLNISEVAYDVGFSDPKYFSRLFTREFNQSPRDFRKKQVA